MNKRFSVILREIRITRNLSQSKLAELLDVDRSAVAHWESGDRIPSTKQLLKLSKVLDMDLAMLFPTSASDTDKAELVMIVDDEVTALMGAKKVVSDALPNADVVAIKRPSDAVKFASANKITLVLLDIEMGKSNGLFLSKKIHDANPSANIIYLTAYPEYALDAWSTCAKGFLVKPLKKETLLKKISMIRESVI